MCIYSKAQVVIMLFPCFYIAQSHVLETTITTCTYDQSKTNVIPSANVVLACSVPTFEFETPALRDWEHFYCVRYNFWKWLKVAGACILPRYRLNIKWAFYEVCEPSGPHGSDGWTVPAPLHSGWRRFLTALFRVDFLSLSVQAFSP